ncbi:hypothetical protein V2G26_013156 [Clonostachys chloroleuca]
MKAKRAACDRCHTMKMQCKTDSSGKICRRCRNAGVECRYSEPGRPGRPTIKSNNTTKQGGVATAVVTTVESDVKLTEAFMGTIPTPSPPHVDEQQLHQRQRRRQQQHSWIQNSSSPSYSPTDEAIYLASEQNSDCSPQEGLLPSPFPASPYQHPNVVEGDWLWDISQAELCPQSLTLADIRNDRCDLTGLAGLAMDHSPTPVSLNLEDALQGDGNCLEHVAHFQLKIARKMNSLSPLSPAHLEQEAAHVLQCSAEFLNLVTSLINAEKRWKSSQQSSTINTAVFLQLTSICIRLTEMHYWLYSSIYCYLCTNTPPVAVRDEGDKILTKLLSFSVAGVDLTPSCPHFRLQMLLHTGVHYLDRIQKSRESLKSFTLDGASEQLPGLALQMHMLITEDQRSNIGNVYTVINKLKQRFDVDIIL